ncbi:MAG: TrmH family RNA methyltransferase [Myxococcota bacterium]
MAHHDRIDGVRPVLEALRAGRRRIHRIEISRRKGSPGLKALAELATERQVPWIEVSGGESTASAEADPFPEEPFEALLGPSGPRRLVALDRVTDVGNLGSIARSAVAAGMTGLLLEHHHAPPIGPGALRASAGALEHLRVGRTPNLARSLALARDEGLRVLGAVPGGLALRDLEGSWLSGDLIWVFGSEDRGLRAAVERCLEVRVGIPMAGSLQSLGVAAAAAHLLLQTAERREGRD